MDSLLCFFGGILHGILLRLNYRCLIQRKGRMADDILRAQKQLVEFEQHHVDLIDIIAFVCNEIFDDDVELIAPGQGIAGTANEVTGFFQIQPQGNGKGNSGCLRWLILRIVPDLGEELPVDIGPLVDLGVFLTGAVYQSEQRFGETDLRVRDHFRQLFGVKNGDYQWFFFRQGGCVVSA